ncbi:protein-tyrosine-phosphatase MKP1-like [Mercurialis annua]|uniref:protein-tyrosine-phosphatase MKP1-like n=1 Tax=Mercurialis annua TaxID=3986 RepID=UPI00215FA0CB|nr:protein-tyrosine-phosphatase MKP1-like [Mercurialis annua]
MFSQQDKNDLVTTTTGGGSGGDTGGFPRKPYLRSVSWSDRSPTKPIPRTRAHQFNSKARSCLPPLQPLSIARRPVEEWPTAGSDDLGVWPHPQTPRGPVADKPLEKSDLEKEKQQPVREFQFKKDKLAFFDKECSRIADHIYLGSDAVAKNREILRQNGITHVLNCVGFVCPEYFKSDLVYKTLWLQDSPSEDITSILYDVFDYFEDVRENDGKVLVHCCQGVSRSTSLVIAYLMWREGQSFEDAFQYVKAARGVTNPNMGFACQLLQCQKRVHAVPASPNSVLRIYRMAPHSPYDPLHLVPKMLSQPDIRGLDSRGAFIVHVPTNIFVWVGNKCSSAMSNQAKIAANQVIQYEKAQGPTMIIKEGEEPSEFWDGFAIGQIPTDDGQQVELNKEEALSNERKVNDYDSDFELFREALAGGVVPPFSVSNAESETCLPARENRWGRLRQKFASGIMKEFLTSTKLNQDLFPYVRESRTSADGRKELEHPVSLVGSPSTSPSSASPCGSPNSFDCFLNSSPYRIKNSSGVEQSLCLTDPSLPPPTPSSSSTDSFPCFPDISPKFNNKSPTLSPSTSDYSSSSFAFSPSSSNWSDLSYLSSRQPSPSGWETIDPFYAKNVPLLDKLSIPYKETPTSPTKEFSGNHGLKSEKTSLPLTGTSPSIAERRGNIPPPCMVLPSIIESSQVSRSLVRSWSFSLTDSDDDEMKDMRDELFEHGGSREEQMPDADISNLGNGSQSKTEEGRVSDNLYNSSYSWIGKDSQITTAVLYLWPSMKKVDLHCFRILDSRSVYNLLAPSLTLGSSSPGILYVWLGREIVFEEGQSELISRTESHKDSHPHCMEIGRSFLSQHNFPDNIPIQIVREGEEPEQFVNLFNNFSFQKVEDNSEK